MSEDKPDFRQAVRKLSKRLGSDDEHPTPEVLVAYHEAELSDAETDRVREHLAGCAECAREVLDYGRFGDELPEDEAVADRAKAQDWEAIQDKLNPP